MYKRCLGQTLLARACYNKLVANFDFTIEEKRRLADRGVSMLVLFGSQAQNTASENSDYDFLVFGPNTPPVYDMIYDLLSAKINKLVDIDIVFESLAPMELLNHVAKYGSVVFATYPKDFADFRQKVMLSYSDFAPYRYLFQKATLDRV